MSFRPESPEAAAELIRAARAEKKPLIPSGGRSRLAGWPQVAAMEDRIISADKLKKVVSVEPENLLAIVEAGLTPAEVRQALEPTGLYWPVSGLDKRSLGAIMAEGAVSLENMARGSMIDWVLGTTFIEPGGRLVVSGGRTLKNVSGYDFTRFQWKAWGSLGFSAAFVLKCLPRPELSRIFEMEMPGPEKAAEAAEKIILARNFPQNLKLRFKDGSWSVLIWHTGFKEFVEAQGRAAREAAGADAVEHDDAQAFWNRENWPLEAEGAGCWLGSRAALLDLARAFKDLNASGFITSADLDIGGGLARLRFAPSEAGGLKILEQKSLRPSAPSLEGEIYSRLKKGLDPEDLFFPSNLYHKAGA